MKTIKLKPSGSEPGNEASSTEEVCRDRILDAYRKLGVSSVSDAPFCGAEEFGIMVGYKTGLYGNRVIIMSAGTEK